MKLFLKETEIEDRAKWRTEVHRIEARRENAIFPQVPWKKHFIAPPRATQWYCRPRPARKFPHNWGTKARDFTDWDWALAQNYRAQRHKPVNCLAGTIFSLKDDANCRYFASLMTLAWTDRESIW